MSEETKEKGAGRSLLKILGKQMLRLVLLGNVLVLAWLWGCCLVTWIPCDSHPYISLLSITFPIALLVNVLFVPVWLILHRRYVWVPLLGTLLCWGYIRDYCPINRSKDLPEACLKVVSWNTMGMGKAEDRDASKDYVKNLDADIICLQEAAITGGGWENFIADMKSLGYEHHCQKGLTLFTRLHILATDTLCYDTRSNGSRWYLLAQGEDTIALVNNHLESNHLSAQIKEEYGQVIDRPGYHRAKQSGHSILSHMAQSARFRGNQTKALRDFVKEHQSHRIIVCGDFNDTPISYACQTLQRHLKNAFRESGRGVGISYNEKGFWVRIDHIFFSSPGESYRTFVDSSIGVSDHYPIISWLNFE